MIKILNKIFNGTSLVINSSNNIIIDGKKITLSPEDKIINIVIEGDIPKLDIASCNSLTVNGNVGGSVKLTNGDIKCGDVNGGVETVNGDIVAKSIQGNTSTVNGDINVY